MPMRRESVPLRVSPAAADEEAMTARKLVNRDEWDLWREAILRILDPRVVPSPDALFVEAGGAQPRSPTDDELREAARRRLRAVLITADEIVEAAMDRVRQW
jgi:hypothetical protein